MSRDSDNPIFLPSDDLQTIFEELEEEFEDQVHTLVNGPLKDDDSVYLASQEAFMEAFRTHTHRYQQMYLLLGDMGLLQNSLLDIEFITILIPSEPYVEGKLFPVIRQDEDHMYVGFQEPPVQLNLELTSKWESDHITVASIPLLPTDKRPYDGRSVITTGMSEEMEVVLILQEREEKKIALMWGQFVLEQLSIQDPAQLN